MNKKTEIQQLRTELIMFSTPNYEENSDSWFTHMLEKKPTIIIHINKIECLDKICDTSDFELEELLQ